MMRMFCSIWLLLIALGAHALDESQLLAPNEAFKPTVARVDERTLAVHFQIAPGYYLYKHRFQFSLQPGDLPLEVQLPEGKRKTDEFFGEVETYRDRMEATLKASAAMPASARLKLVYQGCADAGICYPPQTVELAATGGTVNRIASLLGIDAAPKPQAAPAPSAPTPPPPVVPAARGKALAAPAEAVVARPAVTETATAATAASPPAQVTPVPLTPPPAATTPVANDEATTVLRGWKLPAILAFFFVAGLGLAFTACMYPLIPIVSGIVVGHHHCVSKWRGALLSFAYVQGMALTYAAVGVGAAMTGTFLVAALQNPWVLGAFGLFFVAMALSMFGLYTLQLPNSLQGRLMVWSNRLPGGHLLPVFAMGALSALIVGPCVAPPLAAALGYIGQTGDVWIGGLALYSMALGIGLPLVFVGIFGGHVLPRAGAWMDAVKEAFGIVMLLVALWITRPILPEWFIMLALAALLIAIAVQLHALEPMPTSASGWRKVSKALGLLLLLIGVAQLVGLLAGTRDPFQPLKGVLSQTGTSASAKPAFTKVGSVAELDAAIASARGKPVLLDFYADWCVSCIEMEKLTFADARVAARLQDFVLLKVDVTNNTAAHQALLARFKLFGPPGIIFFDREGKERAERLVGFEAAAPFLARLDRAAGT